MEKVTSLTATETERMQLRGLIRLASEIIAPYWPMRTFVHHNPLHGLERLPFEEAVQLGNRFLGGEGYLTGAAYRDYFHSGRIQKEQIDAALLPYAQDKQVVVGNNPIRHLEVLRVCLLKGMGGTPEDNILPVSELQNHSLIEELANHLIPALKPRGVLEQIHSIADDEAEALLRGRTLSVFLDRILGTDITEQINGEMINWLGAFLDEGHAPWSMPNREDGFFRAWKSLLPLEFSPCGIAKERRINLPEQPEEMLIESFNMLGIPPTYWQDYLALHLAALPGWTGFIKWRADQTDYPWQESYPTELTEYLAVRLWYERELVEKHSMESLGIDGNFEALSNDIRNHKEAYALRRERVAGRLPAPFVKQVNQIIRVCSKQKSSAGVAFPENDWKGLAQKYATEYGPRHEKAIRQNLAFRLVTLAEALEIDPDYLLATPPHDLATLLGWIDAFPEWKQAPVWLKALESGYQEQLLSSLMKNRSASSASPPNIRPQAQAVFCIDVRSELLRRHLETVGDYETFGFAGFFAVFIRYRALGDHHQTDQFPVIMKCKNEVREIPRSYQGQRLPRYRAGTRLLHLFHELFHDLKENVITPYVMVEMIGWFYTLPIFGKTVGSVWYRKLTTTIQRIFSPPIATSMTIDKLSREEVEAILAAEQRAVIRKALKQHVGEREINFTLEQVEFLRLRALSETPMKETVNPQQAAPQNSLSPDEEADFISLLRDRYGINSHRVFARMERMTRTGFTLDEQIFTVETALRMMGLTQNFARLVLIVGHGSDVLNNPYASALDCGACGGHSGKSNARVLAAMANKREVRDGLAKNGILIPSDTCFIAGEHITSTDEVHLFDLEDLSPLHRTDLGRLISDLKEAGVRTSMERLSRLPQAKPLSPENVVSEVRRWGGNWSQVRPEWGLSSNAAFIIGRRELTRGIALDGRVFLHSYDYRGDPTGRLLEIVMTGPQVVGQWINMEHYFSTVDNDVYGSGSKIYHNVVGRFGVMSGPESDLRVGLSRETVMNGPRPYHEPMRLVVVIEAPRERIDAIISHHQFLQHYYNNEWVHLVALDPGDNCFYRYLPKQGWTRS